MSKRKPLDKAQARERRNRLLDSAAAAQLSLTEGVREMRAVAGMTQEEFARHRGVSARAIKAIELGQGNPTVATLNRIGRFFGLEVAFVPIKHASTVAEQPAMGTAEFPFSSPPPGLTPDVLQKVVKKLQEDFDLVMRHLSGAAYHVDHVKPDSEPIEGPATLLSENNSKKRK